jgi:hypothetical protein
MDMPARHVLLVATLMLVASRDVMAQVPPPPPASPTLWSFLGIPQGLYKLNAQVMNRRGNFPGLEKRPPLKAIADVENLKSEVPAIKAAAEIKQAEDLAPQKIKAIKYLATIGCSCYDKDEKVTKAILAATEDCTEDVRLESVRAIEYAAQGEACEHCKQRSCCNEKLVAQLSKMAYERDDNGCYVEPSERVREAATAALRACCPNRGPLPQEAPAPAVPVEGADRPPAIEGAPPQPGGDMDPAPPPPTPEPEPTAGAPATATRSTRLTSIRRPFSGGRVTDEPARRISLATVRDGADVGSTSSVLASAADSDSSGDSPADRKVNGHIVHVAQRGDFMHLHLRGGEMLPVGAAVKVYQSTAAGERLAARLEVTESQAGWANARLTTPVRGRPLARGDEIESWR